MKFFINQLVIIIFLLIDKLTQGLQWAKFKNVGLNESRISLRSTRTGPIIDVYRETEVVIVKDIGDYNYPITIYCFITGDRRDSQLSYRFCAKNVCHKVTNYQNFPELSNEISCETFTEKKGIKLEITLNRNGDSSDNIYCEVTDDKNHLYIRSASIQIRDVYYWKQNLVMNENNLKTIHSKIDKSNLPITFPCFTEPLTLNENPPKWIPLERFKFIHWYVCPIKPDFHTLSNIDKMTFQTCVEYSNKKWPKKRDEILQPKSIKEMTTWKYFIDKTGNLTIFDVDSSSLSYAIMCFKKKNSKLFPINTYITEYSGNDIEKGVIFDTSKRENEITLKAISPIYQSVSIAARKGLSFKDEIQVSIKYYSSSSAKWKWFYNGKEINNNFLIYFDKYSIHFKGEITVNMEGTYNLEIKDAESRLNFTVFIEIIGSPILINRECIPKVYYAWEKENIAFSCNYLYRPNKFKFKINQQEINANYSEGKKLFRQEHYPYLNSLRFEISPMPPTESLIVNTFYKAYSLNKSQDHRIMISMENNYGLNLISSSIYVLPLVESLIQKFPHESDCLGYCSSNEEHDFYCRFKQDQFVNKELQIYHYWFINNQEIILSPNSSNILIPYLTIDPNTKDLKLHPIHSNDSERDNNVKKLLMNNAFECHIKLVSKFDNNVIYDSRYDEKLKKKFFSKITLDNKTAYIIYGVFIVLFVLLIVVIGILLAYQSHKNRGKTYKIEKIDINLGIDPESEMDDLRIKEYQPWSEYADKMFNSCTDMNGNYSGDGYAYSKNVEPDENEYEQMNMNTF